MKIVQLSDGKYAIRKWSWLYLRYTYRDLVSYDFWWPSNSAWIKDCMSTDLLRIEKEFDKLSVPTFKVIKVIKVIK